MAAPALRGISDSHYRGALTKLQDEGWIITRGNGGHLKLRHPDAAFEVHSSSTPSCNRVAHKVQRDCRRALSQGAVSPIAQNDETEVLSQSDVAKILKARKDEGNAKHLIQRNLYHAPKAHAKVFGCSDKAMVEVGMLPCLPKRNLAALTASVTLPEMSKPIMGMKFGAADRNKASTAPTPVKSKSKSKSKPQLQQRTQAAKKSKTKKIARTKVEKMTAQTAIAQTSNVQGYAPIGEARIVRDNTAVRHISSDVLEIAMKIAEGRLRRIEITPDMVGQAIFVEGEVILPTASASVSPTAGAEVQYVPVVTAGAKSEARKNVAPLKPVSRQQGLNRVCRKVIQAMRDFNGGEPVLMKDITALIWSDMGYASEESARAAISNQMRQAEKLGHVKRTYSDRAVVFELLK